MAETDPKPAESKPTTRTTAATTTEEPPNPDEVEIDERYVGVDPIYANSAYEEPLEPEAPSGRSADAKDEKEAVEAEQEMIERVKANEAGTVVSLEDPVPFEEWVESGASSVATRHQSIRGLDQEQLEVDKEATEGAKDESGKIPPSSGSVGQPGVHSTGP